MRDLRVHCILEGTNEVGSSAVWLAACGCRRCYTLRCTSNLVLCAEMPCCSAGDAHHHQP